MSVTTSMVMNGMAMRVNSNENLFLSIFVCGQTCQREKNLIEKVQCSPSFLQLEIIASETCALNGGNVVACSCFLRKRKLLASEFKQCKSKFQCMLVLHKSDQDNLV